LHVLFSLRLEVFDMAIISNAWTEQQGKKTRAKKIKKYEKKTCNFQSPVLI